MIWLWIVLGLVVLLLLFGVVAYNRFVSQRQQIKDAYANIDTELRRRYEVTRARAAAIEAQGPAQQAQAENVLTSALRSLFAVAESYPELRASENFQALQAELSNTEDRIQVSRRFYNANVREYNERVQSVPSNVIASTFGFKEEEFFEIEEADRATLEQAPRVDFSGTGPPPPATPPPAAPAGPPPPASG